MKKLFSNLFFLGLLIPFCEVTKANEYQFLNADESIIDNTPTIKFYGESSSGTETLLNTWESTTTNVDSIQANFEHARVDQYNGKIYFEVEEEGPGTFVTTNLEYDLSNNTIQKMIDSDKNLNNRVIHSKVISEMISKNDSTGVLSLGNNSLKLKETSSTQEMWGTDASGNKIPINIVDSELQIDGTGVQSQITSNATNISSNKTDISALEGLISTKSGSTTTARIGDSTKNTLEIGPTTNPTTIDQSGISVSGGNLIKKDSDGNIHIGKNSFVIGDDVLNGAHPIWAEDENGTKIPLNIYGSDLQINGVSVQGQIDTNTSNISTNTSNIKNIGEGVAGSTALTAALTALPQTSKESKLSCGVGSGAYSSRYAVGFGCASKLNERVDVNAGGSYVFGGSKSYGEGTLDSGVVKAGFVFKLGALKKPTQISMEEKENFKNKIESLEEKNKQLLSRLERLEKIALSANSSKDLAIYKLK